jgi:hypothetical protein
VSQEWASWLSRATERLHGLLAARTPGQLAALGTRCPEASAAELDKARELVKRVVSALDKGDVATWRRLALALDVADVGSTARDDEPAFRGPDDATLPAGQPPPKDLDTVAGGAAMTGASMIGVSVAGAPMTGAAVTTLPSAVALQSARASKGGTIKMQAIVAPPASAPDSSAPSSAPQSVLDIEKYAVLCAWIEVHPSRRQQLHQRYGLANEEDRARLDREFEALFQRDLRLRAAFDKRLREHLGFLRSGSR